MTEDERTIGEARSRVERRGVLFEFVVAGDGGARGVGENIVASSGRAK